MENNIINAGSFIYEASSRTSDVNSNTSSSSVGSPSRRPPSCPAFKLRPRSKIKNLPIINNIMSTTPDDGCSTKKLIHNISP